MKENWICPDVQVQQFAPQEFVAVCLTNIGDLTCPEGEECVRGWEFSKNDTQGIPSPTYTTDRGHGSYVMLSPDGFQGTIGGLFQEEENGTITNLYTGYVYNDADGDGKVEAGEYITWGGALFKLINPDQPGMLYKNPAPTTYTQSGHS